MLASSSYFQRIHNKYVDALAADPEDRDGAVALLAELVNAGMSHLSCHEALREAFAAFLELFPRSEGLDAPSSGGPPGDAATDEEIDEYIARELTYLRRDVSKDRLDRILAAAQKKSLPPSVDQPRVEPNRVPPPGARTGSQGLSKEMLIAAGLGIVIVVVVIAGIVMIRR